MMRVVETLRDEEKCRKVNQEKEIGTVEGEKVKMLVATHHPIREAVIVQKRKS